VDPQWRLRFSREKVTFERNKFRSVVKCTKYAKVCGASGAMRPLSNYFEQLFFFRFWLKRPLQTIRYDTRCYFNVRSKVHTSQLNLPHGTDNIRWEKEKLKCKNG